MNKEELIAMATSAIAEETSIDIAKIKVLSFEEVREEESEE